MKKHFSFSISVMLLLLLTSIVVYALGGLKLGDPPSDKPSCSSLPQGYSVAFQSIKLCFDFSSRNPDGGNYATWEYQDDRDELMRAHPWNHSYDGNISGYFDSFASIMDCYKDFSYGSAYSRRPSIEVNYTGRCSGSISINYLPNANDSQHWYIDKQLVGAPTFSSNNVTQGAVTIKSIKSEKHGIQLKWPFTITSNEVENIDEMSTTKVASVSGITLYAVVSSDVPAHYTDNDILEPPVYIDSLGREHFSFGVRYPEVKSSSFDIVENTIPQEVLGKKAIITPAQDIICAPQLEGPIYICGEYSTAVKWNKPTVLRAITTTKIEEK